MKTFRLFYATGDVSILDIESHVSITVDSGSGLITLSAVDLTPHGRHQFTKWENLKAIHEISRDKLCKQCGVQDAGWGLDMCYPCLRHTFVDASTE